MIQIITCNNHLGVGEKGLTHNIEKLKELDPSFESIEVKEVLEKDQSPNQKLKNYTSVLKTNQKLAQASHEVHLSKKTPLHILGDHAASIGTVSASSQQAQNLGLIWIDAHPDLNTDETTFSGNIHGMSVAALMDLFDDQLNNVLFEGQKIKPENMVYIGLRDIDSGEQEFLEKLNITAYTYEQVKELGLDNVLNQINDKFKSVDKLHISLDLDSMNPKLVPAVSVPVIDGFTPEDVSIILDSLITHNEVVALDIVEFNPLYDQDDKVGHLVLDFIKQIKSHFN